MGLNGLETRLCLFNKKLGEGIGGIMLRLFLEVIRITAIFLIFGALMGTLLKVVYASMGTDVNNTGGAGMMGLSILILIFVWYRNRLQFSGFYKGEKRLKLPKTASVLLVSCSVLVLILVPVFH